tara:strand:- start:535 stop:921 length:387 start_codon:yes stop_codon:yes gene_type:complete
MNNILIGLSLLLNGGLLIYLFGMLPFFLFISCLINIALIVYITYSINQKSLLEEDLDNVYESIENFSNHLEEVHSLEMYYGDQNLQNLIDHSRALINELVDFQVLHADAEVQIESDNGEEEETTKTEE